MNPLLNKLRWIARRSGKEAELRDELEFHLEQEAAEAAVAGLRQLLSESLLLASIGGLLALGCGRLWLSDARVARQVVEAIRAGEGRKSYELSAWVVMPNHVHLLILPQVALPQITQWIKGRTGQE